MKSTKRKSQPKLKPVPVNCIFCKEKKEPDYKETAILQKYVTDREKILAKSRTGLCAKHQRRLSRAIKRARHISLLYG